ncbi:MAG: tryptophan--tRNA ligase, partial [Candidatus Thermoplasmatota archaeon]|nr:tryptophan--tRNA ligase [Candidatus Thermoplasmatota archaeon]
PSSHGYGFLQPSSTYHRFITGLTGEKMSSSKPESAIFLTDTPQEAKKKIMNAKTGGAVSLEEQKKTGGKPDECMVYELFLYHLIEDDDELKGIFESCKKGELMCGMCKKRAAELMEHLLLDLQEKRKKAADQVQEVLRKYYS